MLRSTFLVLAVSGLMLTSAAVRANNHDGDKDYKTFSANDVFNLEYAADPQISPDGKTIVLSLIHI